MQDRAAPTGIADIESELLAVERASSGLRPAIEHLRSPAKTASAEATGEEQGAFSERFAEFLSVLGTIRNKAILLACEIDRQRKAAEVEMARLQAPDAPAKERQPTASWRLQRFLPWREEPALRLFRDLERLLDHIDRLHACLHLTQAAVKAARAIGLARTAQLIEEEVTLLGEVEAAQHDLSALEGEMHGLKRGSAPKKVDRRTAGDAVRDPADLLRQSKAVAARVRALRHEALALRKEVTVLRRLTGAAIDRSAEFGGLKGWLVALAEIAVGLFAVSADLANRHKATCSPSALNGDSAEGRGLAARLTTLHRLGALRREDAERRMEAAAPVVGALLAQMRPESATRTGRRTGIRLRKRKLKQQNGVS